MTILDHPEHADGVHRVAVTASSVPRILVVGGYGTFGGRLVRLISDIEGIAVHVAGRSLPKAMSFCNVLEDANATLVPTVFDREGDVAAALDFLRPHVVVDATGPFQDFGDDPYRLIRACIAAGIGYLDLADGADFVEGVSAFDAEANDAGVFVLSGVSSFPVLTAAVVRRLSQGLSLVTVPGGIAPSPYAGVGPNVIKAVLGYAGRPVKTGIAGTPVQHGLTGGRFFTVAPPGALPLRPTLFSLVDVPDLRAIPALWPGLRSVWMGAGPVPEILHRVLILLAKGVARGWLPSVGFLAPVAHAATHVLRWGEDRGGMFVQATGRTAEGRLVNRSWHMTAEGVDGPMIPSMAAEAVVRKWLADGASVACGARNAACDLELSDYEAMFARRSIAHGVRHDTEPPTDTVLGRVLDRAFADLPAPVQEAHGQVLGTTMEGFCQVERGTGMLARIIASVVGFPATGKDVPVHVKFEIDGSREIWRRHFAFRPMTSTQEVGSGRFGGLMVERFGPAAFGMAVLTGGGRLTLVLRRWTLFGVPMPLSWAPRSTAYEDGADGRFNFHVGISHPLTGPIVRYAGWLKPRGGVS